MLRKQLDKLVDLVHNADEMPDEVAGAINDVLAHADDPVPWYKALFFKNGKFSKTAMFASIVNLLVIVSFVLGWFKGTQVGPWVIPAFDATAGFALMAMADGAYLINNQIKAKNGG